MILLRRNQSARPSGGKAENNTLYDTFGDGHDVGYGDGDGGIEDREAVVLGLPDTVPMSLSQMYLMVQVLGEGA